MKYNFRQISFFMFYYIRSNVFLVEKHQVKISSIYFFESFKVIRFN